MDTASPASGFSAYSLLPALLLVVGSAFGVLSLSAPSRGPVAAIFPPWWDRARSMQAAALGGDVVRYGALPFIIIVVPDGPGSYGDLRLAGSWLLLDPTILGGCGAAAAS